MFAKKPSLPALMPRIGILLSFIIVTVSSKVPSPPKLISSSNLPHAFFRIDTPGERCGGLPQVGSRLAGLASQMWGLHAPDLSELGHFWLSILWPSYLGLFRVSLSTRRAKKRETICEIPTNLFHFHLHFPH